MQTVTATDILARSPCDAHRRPAQFASLDSRYRRSRWSALEILSLDDVPASDRLWCCLHNSLCPEPVLIRFACEVTAEATRLACWTDESSWGAALDVRLRFARGEATAQEWAAVWAAVWAAARDAAWAAARDAARAAAWAAARDAARDAAWAAARDAAWAAQLRTLRTLLLLHLDGYDVLRGELGKPITERRG